MSPDLIRNVSGRRGIWEVKEKNKKVGGALLHLKLQQEVYIATLKAVAKLSLAFKTPHLWSQIRTQGALNG